ncbi:MAG: TIR domain-containing protein [Candidatus Omnitrophota bacterium]|nr:TIR domain-containing protein [Candidatus Omnitrophota bacterium]
MSYQYDVALSFAGEDRSYVDRVAEYLRSKSIRVFYDEFEEVNIWGKDLVEHFAGIYSKEAKYCVMFISRHYAEKAWPRHEKQSALARALGDQGYILPVRFDDTDIPGLLPTVGYIDLRKNTPEQLSDLIVKKLGQSASPQAKEQSPPYRRPKVSKSFDPYKASHAWVDYLAQEIEKRCASSDISFSSFQREGKQCLRFVVNGKPVYAINVQVGGFHRDHGLSFSYAHGEMHMTSGYNAFADFEWDKDKECVVLKMNDFSSFSRPTNDTQGLNQQEFIEYMWEKVCDAIEGR